MRPRLTAVVTTTLVLPLLAAVSATAPAQAGPPAGPEFRVNTFTPGTQDYAKLAVDAAGDAVVVWDSSGQDGGTVGIYGQRYNADGSPRGTEFHVNVTTGTRILDDVAMDPAGNVVVTWTGVGQDGSYDVYARRFGASRVASPEVRINPTTAGDQQSSAVAMDAAGNYAISWTSDLHDGRGDSISVRRFTASGSGVGPSIVVSQSSPGSDAQKYSDIAMSATGSFVVAWSYNAALGASSVFAQRYDAAGAPRGIKTVVDTGGELAEEAVVAMDADGDYVVGWTALPLSYDSSDVYVRRFSAAGVALDPPSPVSTSSSGHQEMPALAMDPSGDYLVVWTVFDEAGDRVYGRRFSGNGTPQAEFRPPATATGVQSNPAVALDADGDAVVVWAGGVQYSNDSDVFARRFRGASPVDLRLTQVDDVDPAPVLGQVTYRMQVTNLADPSTETGVAGIDAAIGTATGVRVVSTIPGGATYSSATGAGWTCVPATTKVTCRLASPVPAGEVSSRLALTYTMPGAADTVFDAVRVDADQLDPVASNNTSTEATSVECVIQFPGARVSASEDRAAVVEVDRTGTGCGTSSVEVDTVAGSATPGTDYDETGAVVVFGGADTTATVEVAIVDDSLDERDETFRARLSDADGALLGHQTVAVASIADDDDPPRINFTTTDGSGGEPGALLDATLRLSEVSGQLVTVTLDPSGTATYGDDYFAPTRISVPPGQRSVDFTIEVADDDVVESDERAFLTLVRPVAVTLGSLDTFHVYITSDE